MYIFVKQLAIASLLNIGHLMCGYSVGWSAPVIHKLQNATQNVLPVPLTVTEASWVGSTLSLGIICGPYVGGYLSNIIGRKLTIIIGGFFSAAGNLVLTLAMNVYMIYAGRYLVGFGLGVTVVTNIVYIGEMASPSIRGIILTATGVFHCLGILICYSIGPYISYAAIGYVSLAISLVHIAGSTYIPESPIYYLIKGREQKTIDTLLYLGRGKDTDELKTVMETYKKQKEGFQWGELITIKVNRKSFFIAVPSLFFQQWCGMLAVLFFTTTIFQNAGSSIEPDLATIITGATQFGGTLVVPVLIENVGRKTLMLLSTAGCGLSMTVMGVYFYFDYVDHSSITALGWIPLTTFIVSILCFSFGLNIVPNTLCGELFRPNVRSIGTSITMTISNTLGFLTLTSFGYMVEAVGSHYVFWLFAIVNLIGFVFTFLFVPETKGLSLTEIEKMLDK